MGDMKLFIEALVSAIIALFVLNFFGISLFTLTSLTSFFVILLILMILEEKIGISNRRVLKQMRLEKPIISTVVAFMTLILIALVFTVIHDRISIVVAPLVHTTVEFGLVGLALVLAIAYRTFYHVLFKGVELDIGIDLGIKKRFGKEKKELDKDEENEKKKRLHERIKKEREKQKEREINIQETVEK